MTLPYIINVALILGACLVFYKLLLHRETFYKVNRWVLMVCLAISFALPLLSVPERFSLRKPTTDVNGELSVVSGESRKQQTTDSYGDKTKQPVVNPANPVQQQTDSRQAVVTPPAENTLPSAKSVIGFSFTQLMNWLFWLYWFGVIIFGASFLLQVVILLYRAWRNPVIKDGQYRIVEVSDNKAPCSFGNTIFINPSAYEWETYNQILLHEKIHVRQKHTIDILIAELVLIFQWFNPFAWIYRREIENNLEFLTDDQVTQREKVDKRSYQLSLVKVTAPHLPLSLTTNYNQSILKKRIAMMNKKRSNLHTAWKYFFLLPVLILLACLLNEPLNAKENANRDANENANKNANDANGDANKNANEANRNANDANVRGKNIETEGYWFAVIKDDKVNIRFGDEKMNDMDFDLKSGKSFNATTFKLSELGNIPKGTSGTFTISREAGKMEMTGKFDGNTGMGRYKFVADKAYSDYMSAELKEKLNSDDAMTFFFINVRKEYLQMLKKEGYSKISKEDIIPMAAMKIDAAYIKEIKSAGFKDVTMENLIPLKALNVDAAYIKEIRDAGYKNITTDQLVTFKAQGIDAAYIKSVKNMKGDKGEKGDKGDKGDKGGKDGDDDADDIVSFKAMGITEEYINSFKAAGITVPNDQLVSFKALGVTPEYIKSWHAAGFKDIDPEDFVGMKSQNITPEYMKGFTDMGYKDVKPENLVAFKALGITPEYIKSFEAIGYKEIDFEELPALKSQNITPEYIRSYEALGFKNIKIEEIVSVKAVGVTPEYIKDMRSKGLNYDKLQKYVTLKSID